MIEDVRPIPAKKCPPVIEGAKEGIINDSTTRQRKYTAIRFLEIVQKRLDKELHSITTYGFSVMCTELHRSLHVIRLRMDIWLAHVVLSARRLLRICLT